MDTKTRDKQLLMFVKEAVGLSGCVTMLRLAGDASTRSYYRVQSDKKSVILVTSEPFLSTDPSIICNYAFKILKAPVPSILKVFPEQGLMIKEDLGNTHLQDITDVRKLTEYYNMAINILLSFQLNAVVASPELYPLTYSFTKDKFITELNMTTDHYLTKYKGASLDQEDKDALDIFYNELVDEMMEQKKLLLHRDYHSRNIMLKNEHMYIIDYQDARLGPYTYDLASLIIDPYIELNEQLKGTMIKNYYEGTRSYTKDTYDDFKRSYDLCFLQRGIKILGTFAYQKIVKGSDRYLSYIRPSENKIKQVIKELGRWDDIVLGVLLK